jgi:hypothetical protein
MKKIIVLRHSCDREEERHQHQESDIIHGLPYEKAAKALMGASGYVAYVAKHGYHFTKQLAIKASEQMKNGRVVIVNNGNEYNLNGTKF